MGTDPTWKCSWIVDDHGVKNRIGNRLRLPGLELSTKQSDRMCKVVRIDSQDYSMG